MSAVAVDRGALTEAYVRLGNLHLAAAEVGVSHSVAHRRLKAWGVVRPRDKLTPAIRERIVAYYRDTPDEAFNLSAFSLQLGLSEVCVGRVGSAAGLTKRTRKKRPDHVQTMSRQAAQKWREQGHPRGFLGGTHTPETRAAISRKSHETWEHHKATGTGLMTPENRQGLSDRMSAQRALMPAENAYSRAKHGRRADIGSMYFRSAWEANYARYLNWLKDRGEIEGWEYEPEVFWFEAIKRGVRSYKPDFRVTEKGKVYFVEVKGWMDPKSITKLRRMKKYHPTVEVRVVDAKQYAAIKNAVSRLIGGWE